MNKVLITILYVWFAIFVLFGIISLTSTPNQMRKDNKFIETQIKPSISIVNVFKAKYHRLPTENEFDSLSKHNARLLRTNDIFDSDLKNFKIPDSNSYILAVWRGEWNEYYISWQNRFITNNYNWYEGIKGFLYCLVIGFIPLLMFIFIKRIKAALKSR